MTVVRLFAAPPGRILMDSIPPSAFFPFEPLHQPHGFSNFTDQKRASIANILLSLGILSIILFSTAFVNYAPLTLQSFAFLSLVSIQQSA
jgi:hypothetical protein